MGRISIDTLESAEHLLRKSLNIGFEWSILEEAQQVIDELQIMQEIFSQQMAVMRDLYKVLQGLVSHAILPSERDQRFQDRRRAHDDVESVIADMDQRREELASMERLQTKTRAQVCHLIQALSSHSRLTLIFISLTLISLSLISFTLTHSHSHLTHSHSHLTHSLTHEYGANSNSSANSST